MKRREFILAIGGSSLLSPFAASAQQLGRTYHLAFVSANPREAPQHLALLDELRQDGFVEGQNLMVDQRGFSIDYGKFPGNGCIGQISSRCNRVLRGGRAKGGAAGDADDSHPRRGRRHACGRTRALSGQTRRQHDRDQYPCDGTRRQATRASYRVVAECAPHGRARRSNSTEVGRLKALKDATHASGVELSTYTIDNAERIVPVIDEAKFRRGGDKLFVEPTLYIQSSYHHRACNGSAAAFDPPFTGNRGRRRPNRLRCASHFDVPTNGAAAGQSPARHFASRSSC